MTPAQILNAIETLPISLTHVGSIVKNDGGGRQAWAWTAASWSPRREFANGKTVAEAVNALLDKLEIKT